MKNSTRSKAARALGWESWMGLGSFLSAFAFVLGGCASGIQYSKLAPDADPSRELSALGDQFKRAKSDQVDAFAPDSYLNAERAFNDARSDREQNKSNADILENIAKSRAYLTQAEVRAKQTQGVMGEVTTARDRAVKVGAPTLSSSKAEFAEVDSKIQNFAKDADSVSGVPAISDKDRTQLLAQLQESELHAVQQKALGHAQNLIDKAKAEGAEELAPQSLSTASAKYGQAVATVRRNVQDTAAIEAAAQQANDSAERLLTVTRMAKGNQGKNAEALASATLSQQQAEADLKQQNASLEHQNSAIQGASKLTATVRMLQTKFSADEAQVFEDGKQVHIRLKGLNFPSGSATIQPSNYALMGKVQAALKDTQPEKIEIQGRTDSVGSKSKNRALSERRADAVKQFISASNVVDSSKITTEGYGSSKPVASEKTREGRALNRSIDLLIVPSGVGGAGQAGTAAPEDLPGR